MCDIDKAAVIEELEHTSEQLLNRIAKLEQAKNYYPGFPAPKPRQREIREWPQML